MELIKKVKSFFSKAPTKNNKQNVKEEFFSFLELENQEFEDFFNHHKDIESFLNERITRLNLFTDALSIELKFPLPYKNIFHKYLSNKEEIGQDPISLKGNTILSINLKEAVKIEHHFIQFLKLYHLLLENFYERYYKQRDKNFEIFSIKHLIEISNETKYLFATIDTDFNVLERNELFDNFFSINGHHKNEQKLNLLMNYKIINSERFKNIIERVFHGGLEKSSHEVIHNNQDFITSWSFTPWFSKNGIISGAILKFKIIDVLNKEQSDKNKAKNNLSKAILGMIGHEARTPLSSIIGFSTLIKDEFETTKNIETALNYNEKIFSGATFLEELINNYLDYTKLQDEKIVLNSHPFNIKQVVDEIISPILQEKLKSKSNIKYQAIVNHLLHKTSFSGDSLRIKQIILNFLSNSVKYTHQGTISLNIEPIPSIFEKGIQITIQDTGIGIKEKDLPHIFTPYFTKEDASYLANSVGGSRGTGLGLAITKNFIELMKGDVQVKSIVNEGTIVKIKIPLTISEEAYSPQMKTKLSQDLSKTKDEKEKVLPLLVAEDDEDGRLLIELYLKKMGHPFELAKDGGEVIEKVINQKKKYQVILMDIQMPMIDGYKATSLIRSANIDTPIWALTAHALQEHQEKAKNLGMDGHIKKPINPKDLSDVLNKIYKKDDLVSEEV